MRHPRGELFGINLGALRKVRASELALRFAFGAAISIIAGIGGIVLGSVVGGMLLAFPAIAPATLTLIEKKEGNLAAVHDVGGAIFGGVGLVAFAVAGDYLFGHVGAPVVLAICLASWTVVSIFFYLLRATEILPLPEHIQGMSPPVSPSPEGAGSTPAPGAGAATAPGAASARVSGADPVTSPGAGSAQAPGAGSIDSNQGPNPGAPGLGARP